MAEFEELQRVNYYNGQWLTARIFKVEQDYTTRLMTDHNMALFSAGVAFGLDVVRLGGPVFQITQGLAIDDQGRQLVWPCGGPAQTIPGDGHCSGTLAKIYLKWHESLVCGPKQKAPRCDIVSLLPEVVYNDDNLDPRLKIAEVLLVDGNIVKVDNRKTPVKLKVAADDPPITPAVVMGSATFDLSLHPNESTWKRIDYRSDGKPAFTALPVVTVSPGSINRCLYSLTLSAVTTVGFQVGIMRIGAEKNPACKQDQVTINWQAGLPSSPDGC